MLSIFAFAVINRGDYGEVLPLVDELSSAVIVVVHGTRCTPRGSGNSSHNASILRHVPSELGILLHRRRRKCGGQRACNGARGSVVAWAGVLLEQHGGVAARCKIATGSLVIVGWIRAIVVVNNVLPRRVLTIATSPSGLCLTVVLAFLLLTRGSAIRKLLPRHGDLHQCSFVVGFRRRGEYCICGHAVLVVHVEVEPTFVHCILVIEGMPEIRRPVLVDVDFATHIATNRLIQISHSTECCTSIVSENLNDCLRKMGLR